MDTTSRYVTDLGSWELPSTDSFEERLLDELISKIRAEVLRPEVLGEELYRIFLDRLREIAGVVVTRRSSIGSRGSPTDKTASTRSCAWNFHTCSTTRALMHSRWTTVSITRTERARDSIASI